MKDTLKLGSRGADVRYLQGLLLAVGITLDADGDFGPATDAAVRAFQLWRKLVVDGVVGRKTWLELDRCVSAHATAPVDEPPPAPAAKTEADLRLAGEQAIERALAYWSLDIYDPKAHDKSADAKRCKAVIDTFIRGPESIDWSWEPEYAGDGDFEWCGAFAKKCWGRIKRSLAQLYFPSCHRLDRYAKYRSFQGEKNEGTGRLILNLDEDTSAVDFLLQWEPRMGDILLIGPKGYGQHICLVESFDPEVGFLTVEGNGNGSGPNGERQHGVVRAVRRLGADKPGDWCARRIIRPSVDDLD